MTVAEALQQIKSLLSSSSESPSLDAQVLLAHILQVSRARVLAYPETTIKPEQEEQLSNALEQVQAGLPLPYIIGHWEFYDLDFNVTPSVLIPRPETELLVDAALKWLHAHPARRVVADIGTGSGCIAISLASKIPDLSIIATDISQKALEIAHINAQKHNVDDRIEFIKADLLPQKNTQHANCDVICANLPYIPTATLHTLKVYGREPTLALDGGYDGLNLIRKLLLDAPKHLTSGGLLLLEIDSSQGISALTLAQEAFPEANVQLITDLAGHDRIIQIETHS